MIKKGIEVKEFSWFKNYDWENLYLRNLKTTFIPKKEENFDYKLCSDKDKIWVNTQKRYLNTRNSLKFKNVFVDFHYFRRDRNKIINKYNINN